MNINLNRKSPIPLYRQLYQQLADLIRRNSIKAGTSLPPSRRLAQDLDVSRKTVLEAYDMLQAEGYLESKGGSGIFVAPGAALEATKEEQNWSAPHIGFAPYRRDIIDFRSGIPALREFPKQLWGRLYQEVLRRNDPLILGYQEPQGRMELRQAISEYLKVQRGVNCHPDQLLICSGTTQAIGIIARILGPGSGPAVLENPVTRDIPAIFHSQGFATEYIPVDRDGFDPRRLDDELKPGLVYLAPSHQYPLGSTLPVPRRVEVIEKARTEDFFIVEDDYDSEFRHEGPPLSSLYSLAPERVFYIGTFSKTLFPALRTAYIVLPPQWIGAARENKWNMDLHNHSLDQLTLAEFLNHGHYTRHCWKMKRLYKKKRDVLLDEVYRILGSSVTIEGEQTGLHLTLGAPGRDFTGPLKRKIYNAGVKIYPVQNHCFKELQMREKIILGYGFLQEEQLKKGIEVIAAQLK